MSLAWVPTAISAIGSIFGSKKADRAAENAAAANAAAQQQAYNDAKAYMNQGVNAVNIARDYRLNNSSDIFNYQRNLESQRNQAYNDAYADPANQITDQFEGYYKDAQGQLTDQYGNALNTQDSSLQNALSSLRNNFDTGINDNTGNAVNPYRDAIQNRIGNLSNPVLNYDNDAAYAERERQAQEQMNRQLLARGEFNSSEGLNQNREISTALALQNEQDDYNRALQLAELERARSGELSGLVGSGLNTEQVGNNLNQNTLDNYNRLGTQEADLYMNQGRNVSGIYTGLGDKTAGSTQSMGQDITNLNTNNLNSLINNDQNYYKNISNIYGNQLTNNQDVQNDWSNQLLTTAISQPVTGAGQKMGNTIYDNAGNTAGANSYNNTNMFSNLGTIFGAANNEWNKNQNQYLGA